MNPHDPEPVPPNEPPSRLPRCAAVAALCVLACAGALGGCRAARQVPGELQYAGDAVADWTADVFGIEPKQY